MHIEKLKRRSFIKHSLAAVVSITPVVGLLGSLTKLEAADIGENDGVYKAIVCVLLEGGADCFNMIVPNSSSYDDYKKARGDFALDKETLKPLNNKNEDTLNSETFGFRDNMTSMQELFNQNKLSVISNIGTLIEPVTKQSVENKSARMPMQLFAHNTQRALWMNADAKHNPKDGWAARVGDIFYSQPSNPYFNVTVGRNNIMQTGGDAEAIVFNEPSISPNTMDVYGFGEGLGGGNLGKVYKKMYEQTADAENKLLSTFAKRRVLKLDRQVKLKNLFTGAKNYEFDGGVHEVGKPLGKQLELVSEILSIRDNFPGKRKRQIFFVNHRGWDTHNTDNEKNAGYLSDSLGSFYKALVDMEIENQVTTLTISDFGRSLTTNGSGTDHGWGGHCFVMGGSVRGGNIFGKMPVLKSESNDFWNNRMIPQASVEQYLIPVLKWFGATDDSELNKIFKNRVSFADKGNWFMKG